MRISDATFDLQDQNLFLVSDPRLRADALKHSILPRLRLVLNEAIALIRYVYGLEALEDSIVSCYPNFRTNRDTELDFLYDSAFVGLGGKRVKNKWFGVKRKDGKEVQILPFRFAFSLTQSGLYIEHHNAWLKGLSDESFQKFLDFDQQNEAVLSPLCFVSGMAPELLSGTYLPKVAPLAEHYRFRALHRRFDNNFYSEPCSYPVSFGRLEKCILSFVQFYPVYASYIQIAKGLPTEFSQLIAKLNQWLREGTPTPTFEYESQLALDFNESDEGEDSELGLAQLEEDAALAAETKVRVMPAMRWQVFQRDHWKCVSCGRRSHDGVILHVDHVLPRSKGGKDILDNLQTLCSICNLGKSNRDSTNLRR